MINEEGVFVLGTFVEWSQEKQVNRFKVRLKKNGKRHIKSKISVFNRLNSFMVTTIELTKERKEKKRQRAVKKIKKTLKKYANQITKEYKKEFSNGSNPSDFFVKYLKKAMYKDQANYLKKNHDIIIKRVESQIKDIITEGSVILWDLPGHEDDEIILNDNIMKLEDILVGIDFYNTIDELLIVSFANQFMPFSDQLISEISQELSQFAKFTKVLNEDSHVPVILYDVFQNFIGAISAFQETIKLHHREISLVSEITNEAINYLNSLPSNDIKLWLKETSTSGKNALVNLDKLAKIIEDVKPDLRQFSEGSKEIEKDKLEPIISGIVKSFPFVIGISQWVVKFHDIPSFTILPDGIGYEQYRGERYNPHPGNLIEAQTLFRTYQRGSSTIYALRGVNLNIAKGEFLIVRGPSGAGKTTLLNILAGLDRPSRGAVFFKNRNIVPLNEERKSEIRKQHFSFIFQNYALIPHLSAYENAKLPLDMGDFPNELKKGVNELLEDVGIYQYRKNKPAMLSGGQMQRLGIARALSKRPDILFADEPTGDLDEKTGQKILELFQKYHKKTGITIVMVTHDAQARIYADREILLQDGKIVNKMK
ncbi:MAG: ABC transporter ATP-binding protein [Candidatus Kariarchaeaceae archaeon]|jgi:putative ABC transport system ATP-binding protein